MIKEKVSIVMMAYNQAKFIEEAIKSVLNQKHNYEWELLIADDCSIDNTEEIVNKFLKIYPSNIFYFKNETNIGLHKNYANTIRKTTGEFIALLEADDYWIDPFKIKKQLSLMIANPSINWSFTNGMMVDENGNVLKDYNYQFPEIFEGLKYITNFFNPLNNTIVFRKSIEPQEYPIVFYGIAQWDTFLHYLRSLNGDIGFVSINGLAWRRHAAATSHTNNFNGKKRYLDWIKMYNELKRFYPREYSHFFDKKYVEYEALSILSFKSKEKLNFIKYSLKMILDKPFRSIKEYRDYIWKLFH